jgi:nitrite reductase/ring-hydroxylating ferredoxin subunit
MIRSSARKESAITNSLTARVIPAPLHLDAGHAHRTLAQPPNCGLRYNRPFTKGALFMPDYVKVATLDEIPEGGMKCVEARGHRIALYNLGGKIFATQETCTHAEASLCEGEIQGEEVLCPLHFATFNITTGECTGPPADEDLITYRVRISGQEIEVEV